MLSAGAYGALAATDQRDVAREEVFYRTRGSTSAGRIVQLQIVNISAGGFMARTEVDFAIGDTIAVKMPVIGPVQAEIRWALGGRIGGQFDRLIELAPYLNMLAELVRDAR